MYVGSTGGRLFAVNPDGTERWNFSAASGDLTTPAIGADGTVYVGSKSAPDAHDATLYAVSGDGSLDWSFTTEGVEIFPAAIGPDGTIYLGVAGITDPWGGGLYAINPDGSLKWRSFEQVDTSPAMDADGNIYVVVTCTRGTRLQAFDASGGLNWSYPLRSCPCSSPTIGADGTVYVSDVHGNFYAVSPDGTQKWGFRPGRTAPSHQAVAPDGTVYVASGMPEYVLYAIEPDGSQKWHFSSVPGVQDAPAIGADGTIYIASEQPSFYAITPGGSVQWALGAGGSPPFSPVIGAAGTIYFAADDGKLYAIDEAPAGTPIPQPEPRYTLSINHAALGPGQAITTTGNLANGSISVDPPPGRDGRYAGRHVC